MAATLYRAVLSFLILALLGISTYLAYTWMRTSREYAEFRERQEVAEQQLAGLREEEARREAYLRAFLNDPEFVERVVRERLGYVKPGETVYRFRAAE